jgi:transposase
MAEKQRQQPGNWREARRLQAWELSQKGWKQKDIAEALGVSEGAVSQWLKRARAEGVEALRHRKGGGPKPRLKPQQVAQLPQLLSQGAEAYGFRGEVWTRARVARVIQQQFGVTFSLSHVGRLLQQIGWSRQRPIERASQRDEQAIEYWRNEKWPEIQKKPSVKDER